MTPCARSFSWTFAAACALALGCGSNDGARVAEHVGATSEHLLSACTEDAIRADAPPSALPFFDKAFSWVHAGLMYCQCTESGSSGYRADCSGLVSYAWGLPAPGHTTYSFAGGPWDDHASKKIAWSELSPGDALNFGGDPSAGVGHVMLFAGWLDAAHTKVCAVEESSTGTPAHIGKHSLGDPGSWWGGSGTFGDIFVPIRLATYSPTPPDAPPHGALDAVDCTSIRGWAQDPDTATAAIATHVYFDGPAGTAGAKSIALTANENRADLCKTIGSCDHGFSMPAPRALMDGKPHAVHAYGIDSTAGAANAELPGSPKTLTCPAPALAKGLVKRHVASPTILGDWKLDTFLDLAPYPAATLAALADGVAFDAPPRLVQVTGDAALYVEDHGFKRHVVDPTSMAAWRFVAADIKKIDAATLGKLTAGPDWLAAPLLAHDPAGAAIYALDEPFPAPPSTGADGGAGDGGVGVGPGAGDGGALGDSGGAAAGADANATDGKGGCAMTGAGGAADGGSVVWLLALTGMAFALHRKRRLRGPRGE